MNRDVYTLDERTLDVGDGHVLYIHDWGNKDAVVPIIVLHGGPGGHIKDKYKAPFDPLRHRVIFFDQRGCGKSTPYGSLENNTTKELISDISKIANTLGFEKFILHGSSWGSALALAYALAHPDRVHALVIGGVFTASRFESEWVDTGKVGAFFPDVWNAYLERTPVEHRANPSKYHFDKAINGTPEEQKASGYAYDCLESGIIQLDDRQNLEDFAEYDPAGIRIEIHYLANHCFMPERYILDNAHKLTMPVRIVQGRYDMVCPPATAYELHNAVPDGHLYWTLSGHKHEHEGQNVFTSIFAAIA